jgi:hypothetical protein
MKYRYINVVGLLAIVFLVLFTYGIFHKANSPSRYSQIHPAIEADLNFIADSLTNKLNGLSPDRLIKEGGILSRNPIATNGYWVAGAIRPVGNPGTMQLLVYAHTNKYDVLNGFVYSEISVDRVIRTQTNDVK